MNSKEYIEKLNHLKWLRDIEKQYLGFSDMLEKNSRSITIEGIYYSCRGPASPMKINSHYPIKSRYIYDALCEVLRDIGAEICDLENELKSVVVELSTTQNE